jgi:hypothetical protein
MSRAVLLLSERIRLKAFLLAVQKGELRQADIYTRLGVSPELANHAAEGGKVSGLVAEILVAGLDAWEGRADAV